MSTARSSAGTWSAPRPASPSSSPAAASRTHGSQPTARATDRASRLGSRSSDDRPRPHHLRHPRRPRRPGPPSLLRALRLDRPLRRRRGRHVHARRRQPRDLLARIPRARRQRHRATTAARLQGHQPRDQRRRARRGRLRPRRGARRRRHRPRRTAGHGVGRPLRPIRRPGAQRMGGRLGPRLLIRRPTAQLVWPERD